MKTNKKPLALAVTLLVAGGAAMAQTAPVRPAYQFPTTQSPARGPAAVQLGSSPVFATPFASIAYGNDSNLFLTPANELSTPYQVYGGGVNLDARDAKSVFQMGLLVSRGIYNDSRADNYTDSSARLSYDVAFDPRNFLRAKWDYLRGHDARGTTDRPDQSGPDKYSESTPGITYAYGAPGAQGRAELFASKAFKRYLNNSPATDGSDRDTTDYGGAFYWRVAPKTSLLAEARATDIEYKLSSSTLSGSETRYFVGATWEAMAATTGTVKLGQLKKDYDSARPSYSEFAWEGLITWMPRTYSKVDFYSSRQPIESTGLGDYTLSDASGVVWTHGWNSVVSTDASARFQKDKYQGFPRTDETQIYGLKATYKMRRWLTLGAEYQYTKRDSDLNIYDYDKNLWLISAVLSM